MIFCLQSELPCRGAAQRHTKHMPFQRSFSTVLAIGLIAAAGAFPQAVQKTGSHLTTPKEALGFELGADYQMATYAQLELWWKKLAAESNRMKLVEMGRTAEARPQYMAIISSPENLKKLDRYREIARRLALAEGLDDDEARTLAHEGKAVVWIDGGLHATETVSSQQIMEWVYQMVSRNDAETQRFLSDVILLCVAANPDGQDLVANWYMRNPDPQKRSLAGLPTLYEKYAGHDDNRDFYMSNLPETANMNRVLYREWFPQIMYNHHQTGPRGGVVFIPPFRDPFNYNYDPLMVMQIEQLGTAMHSRLIAEGKYGSGMRGVSTYSTWYNGGLRTTTYFHNIIGLLTEIIGSPTPTEIPLVPERQLPTGDMPAPIAPQPWHYRQSIEYEMTQNRAVMDYASKYRETLLYNIYRMGKNSIERGSRDSWTTTPKRIEMLRAAAAKQGGASTGDAGPSDNIAGESGMSAELYNTVLHKPELRDPRGYILSAAQPDFPTATKFINVLIQNGVTVHRAKAAFTVAGKSYPAGSYVVKSAQAFRPHVLDMFEPQDHPNDFRYPGGPPVPPYDSAGYTLAFLMGVQFDRILDGFDGPFEKLTDVAKPAAGTITGPADPAGYLLSHRVNDSFILVNRLLKQGVDVYWLKAAIRTEGGELGEGAVWIPASAAARDIIERGVKELGFNAYGVAQRPSGDALKLKPVRIGLVDQYGGSMPSGWVRLIFERFEFPFSVVFPKELDAGDISAKYDVLVFMDGAVRAASSSRRGGFGFQQPRPDSIPEEYRGMLGHITPETTVPQVRKFLEAGGDVVTVGSSTSLVGLLGLPLKDALTERGTDGTEHALPRDKYYVPGSVLRATVDTANPLAYGFTGTVDVFFDNDPVYKLGPDAALKGVSPVAWFSGTAPLRSGWAWGQQYLDGGIAIAEASVGEGKLFLLGPEVTFRAQPHGTFKFLFNGIYYGTAKPAKLTN